MCGTCEFLAERRSDGGSFDQRCLANVLQVLDFRHPVVVDKVVVFFGCNQGPVDLISQVLNAHVLVVTSRHRLHQFCGVLERWPGGKKEGRKEVMLRE